MATVSERLALIVTADTGGAVRELNRVGATAKTQLGQAETAADRYSSKMISLGTAAVAGGAVAAAGLWQAVQASADLGEAANKASVIFGDSYGTIDQFAKGAADSIGQSNRAALDAASTFGGLGQAAGLTGPQLAGFSTSLTKLASDLASFNNTTPEDAVMALGSALRGENEPIRRYNVLLDDATLKQEAFARGLTTNPTATLTPAVKTLAAYQVILKQTTNAQDDYARTADSMPNRLRNMTAEWENMKASVGEGALPVMERLVGAGQALADKFGEMPGPLRATVGQVTALGTVAVVTAGGVSVLAGSLLRLKAAQDAAAAGGAASRLAGAAGPLTALAVAAGVQLELNRLINEEFAESVDRAAVSQERLAQALATGDLRDLEQAVRGASAAASEGPDLTNWNRFQDGLRNSLGLLTGLTGAAQVARIFNDAGRDRKFQIDAFNESVARFREELAGMDPDRARAAIEAFVRGMEGGIVPTRELAVLQRVLIREFVGTGEAASVAERGMRALIDATTTAGEAVKGTADAADSLKSANDRVAAAQKRLADATKRDGKAIESAYERVVAAKERLDEILAGDGNNLEQESPLAQEERARAKLREAEFRLAAADGNDPIAAADKAEALQAITDAQQRGQDLLRNAQDIARQTRDARRDLEDAQQTYNETLKGNPEEVKAAQEELATAERDRAALLTELGVAFQEGKISVEAYKAELDRQVAAGIISPESAAILKGQVDSLATQVGLAAAALGTLPGVIQGLAQREGVPAYQTTPGAYSSAAQSAIGTAAQRAIQEGIRRGTEQRFPMTAQAGRAIGLGDDPLELNGQTTTDKFGRPWSWNGKAWIPRADGGPMLAGQGYLVGERGPELIVPNASGYVLNAGRTQQVTGTASRAGATFQNTFHIHSTAPRETASEVVRKMKARKFLLAGA